jgi:hypothetical protein
MMAGFIDAMNEWRTLIRASSVGTVTVGAIAIEQRLAGRLACGEVLDRERRLVDPSGRVVRRPLGISDG